MINVLEGISSRGSGFQVFSENAKFQTELLEHFLAPLFDEAAGRNDENATRVRAHDQFADVSPAMMVLPAPGSSARTNRRGWLQITAVYK